MTIYNRLFFLVIIASMVSACTSRPTVRSSYRVDVHPLLKNDKKILLVVDACIRREQLSSVTEYYPIAEAKTAAYAIAEHICKYLNNTGIQVNQVIIPFVCGARKNVENPPQTIAACIGGEYHKATPPFEIENEKKVTEDLIAALSILATDGFQYALIPPASRSATNLALVNAEKSKAAAELVMKKTGATSMLYIGMDGLSKSGGKEALEKVAMGFAGVVQAFVIGGIVYSPSLTSSGSIIGAAIFDLKTSAVAWARNVYIQNDPVKPAVEDTKTNEFVQMDQVNQEKENTKIMELLLKSIVYYPW